MEVKLKELAKKHREFLQAVGKKNTYKSGFDIGFALGSAQAYEDVIKMLNPKLKGRNN